MALKNARYAQSGGVSALIKPACSVLQTARQQSDQIAKVYAGRNGIIVRAQQLGPEDPDLFGFLALGQIMDSPRSWSRSVACAIGDADNDWLECGSLKNTSQLMLSTRNADLNSMGWRL